MNLQEFAEKQGIDSIVRDGTIGGEHVFFKFFREENGKLFSPIQRMEYTPGESYEEHEISLNKKDFGRGIYVSTLKFIVGVVGEEKCGLSFNNTTPYHVFVPTNLTKKQYCIPQYWIPNTGEDGEGIVRVAKARISKEELSWRIAIPHIKKPQVAYSFGRYFKGDLTEELKVLADLVSWDPHYSYNAGRKWKDDRFNPVAEVLTKGVSRDPEYSYYAGHVWEDDRFNPFAEVLAKGVCRGRHYIPLARRDWKDDRKRFLNQVA